MKLREFADLLTDRDYGHEITKEEEALAKELGFVVVFGYSDDNAELRDAYDAGCNDASAWECGTRQYTFTWDEEWLRQPAEEVVK